jgi:hypothetical protein
MVCRYSTAPPRLTHRLPEKLEVRGDAATDRAEPTLGTALAAELARALPDRAA